MNRRNFIQHAAFSSAYVYFLSSLFSSCKSKSLLSIQNQSGGPYTFKEIRNGVGYFEEKGGTIGWSVHKTGISIVDTQFPDQSNNLLSEINKYNPDQKINLLINTHHHSDHTSGNIVFKDRLIHHVAHENAIRNYTRVATQQKTLDKALIPSTSFLDKISYNVGNENVQLMYFGPAHTNGDTIIHYENANVTHLGDLIFNRRFPYIDKSSGAHIGSWIDVLDKIQTFFTKETIFIFGHKRDGFEVTGNFDDIKAFQNYLEKLLEIGQKYVNQGKTIEEMKAEINVIPGAEEWQGDGIHRSLDAVFMELN
ncbi:MAG: MBL fold metallo-hydrolase [Saprospiraceae bacterium]